MGRPMRNRRGLNWVALALGLLGATFIFGLILLPRACRAQTNTQLNLSPAQLHLLGLLALEDMQRYYWPTPLDSLAIGHAKHTHVEVRGTVVYARIEDDGDLHIRLADPWRTGTVYPFVIAECIPSMPCVKPAVGADIIVRGVSRHDPEHGWWEIHPVESWTSAVAGE